MTQPHIGGVVEYAATILLLVQVWQGRAWLLRQRGSWSAARYRAIASVLVALWVISLVSIVETWSGAMYDLTSLPVSLRVSVAAIGYCWVFFSSIAGAAGLLARAVIDRTPLAHSPRRRQILGTTTALAVATPAAVMGYGAFVERNEYGIAELDFPVPDLHPDLDGFRIVQISDLHVSPFLSTRQAGRVVDMANELRADVAVFTGDLITEPGDPLIEAIRELVRLRASDGVFGCMGNHEAYVGCRNYLERHARPGGVDFLRGMKSEVRRGNGVLNIAGVDYQRNADKAIYLKGAERLVVPNATNLLLSHNPDVFPVAMDKGFQGVLSGHTHGGQINVEILHRDVNPARFRTPFTKGLYRSETPGVIAGSCYVTNGIGTIGMPIRLGAPPEIALLRLRRA